MADPSPFNGLSTDRPVSRSADDLLGRTAFAQRIADQALAVGVPTGLVLAITGPWGSGKSSTMALVDEALGDRAISLRFNPWWFTAGDSLVVRFFAELSTQIADPELKASARAYAELLAPLPGMAGALARGVEKVLAESIEQRRDRVVETLRRLDRRVVVFVDDIDRLPPGDIAELVRLVKLVGDFDNVTYVLAFDAQHTARSLSAAFGLGDEAYGSEYLDKIVQVSHALPYVAHDRLAPLLVKRLDEAMAAAGLEHRFARDVTFQALLDQAVGPLLRTLRDVERVANVVPTALSLLEDDVAPCDVVALEVLRIVLPDVHRQLPAIAPSLWDVDEDPASAASDDDRSVQRWLDQAGDERLAVARLVGALFPRTVDECGLPPMGSSRPMRGIRRRVSGGPELASYLSKTAEGHAVRRETVERALATLDRPIAFVELLSTLTPSQGEDLFDRVQTAAANMDWRTDPARAGRSIASILVFGTADLHWHFREKALSLGRFVVEAADPADGKTVVEEAFDAAPSATEANEVCEVAERLGLLDSSLVARMCGLIGQLEDGEQLMAARSPLVRRLLGSGPVGHEVLRGFVDRSDRVFEAVLGHFTETYEDGPFFDWEQAVVVIGERRLWIRLAELTSDARSVGAAREAARHHRGRAAPDPEK